MEGYGENVVLITIGRGPPFNSGKHLILRYKIWRRIKLPHFTFS